MAKKKLNLKQKYTRDIYLYQEDVKSLFDLKDKRYELREKATFDDGSQEITITIHIPKTKQ